jgi:hypothetical protein
MADLEQLKQKYAPVIALISPRRVPNLLSLRLKATNSC